MADKQDRVIFHCDCNGFFASVEALDNPALRDMPMAVAGSPESRRGIVLAKNELAKQGGIYTTQTVWQAKKVCPDPPRKVPGSKPAGEPGVRPLYRHGGAGQHR